MSYPVADIKSRDDVMKMGIAAYNEECRSIVMRSVLLPTAVYFFCCVAAFSSM